MVKNMEFVTSTYSYSFEDYCYFTLLSKIFTLPKLRKSNELLDRKQIINFVKLCSKLNETINAIKNSIETNREFEINPIVETFMKSMTKENKEKLPKDYIKSILLGLKHD